MNLEIRRSIQLEDYSEFEIVDLDKPKDHAEHVFYLQKYWQLSTYPPQVGLFYLERNKARYDAIAQILLNS